MRVDLQMAGTRSFAGEEEELTVACRLTHLDPNRILELLGHKERKAAFKEVSRP
jgi:hypothetical protein